MRPIIPGRRTRRQQARQDAVPRQRPRLLTSSAWLFFSFPPSSLLPALSHCPSFTSGLAGRQGLSSWWVRRRERRPESRRREQVIENQKEERMLSL